MANNISHIFICNVINVVSISLSFDKNILGKKNLKKAFQDIRSPNKLLTYYLFLLKSDQIRSDQIKSDQIRSELFRSDP